MDIYQIIKYEGDNSTFIWKHPTEDFFTGTQLVVHESQEAIFFLNGQALDLFGAGRYTLSSQNMPILNKFINIPTDGKTPFHCEVYFVNMTEQMAVKWGTDSKVQFFEPTYHFPISIGANGEMSLAVSDSRRLLINLVGTENNLNQQQLVSYFRAFLMTKVKSYIALVFKEKSLSIFEADENLELFSNALKQKLVGDFLEYGIHLRQFFVTSILKPEGDSIYEKFKELYFRQYADIVEAEIKKKVGIIEQEGEAQRIVIEAQGIAKKRETEGYTYQQERSYDVAEKVAANEGVGNFSNVGIGLGMMSGIGGTVGNQVGNIVNSAMAASSGNNVVTVAYCSTCGNPVSPSDIFCSICGSPINKQEVVTCRYCGKPFTNPNGRFCGFCGKSKD